ncbi:TetR family transcriptional regulator [Burkholderia aenigmatica]|nr:TetR/AcrR family transcriptional regulator [Burkholderia aenigmatica]UKD15826.1 TetR family transcriptional regulator [Burkholderia aenigmatica]
MKPFLSQRQCAGMKIMPGHGSATSPERRASANLAYEMDDRTKPRAVTRTKTAPKPAAPKTSSVRKTRTKAPAQAPLPSDSDAPMPRGMRSRLATRSKLIEAAHTLMAEKGFDLCTIEEITRQADVGFGSFYNHFESKDEIAKAVFAQRASEIGVITDEISARETDKAVAISCIQKMFLTKAVHDPVWGRFIVRAQDSHRQMNETFVVRASKDIGDGAAQKRFSIQFIDTAADITIAALISAMTRILDGGQSARITIETVECLMRLYGIAPDEARRLAEMPLPDYVTDFFK